MEGQIPGTVRALLVRVLFVIISSTLNREHDRARVPIWSVTETEARIFFRAMYVAWVFTLAFIIYDEAAGLTDTAHDGTFARVEAVMLRFGNMVIPIAATCITVAITAILAIRFLDGVRRFLMTVTNRLYNWLAQPIEARAETRGIAIGEARGIARALGWAQRKTEAESRGLPFDEPPPEP